MELALDKKVVEGLDFQTLDDLASSEKIETTVEDSPLCFDRTVYTPVDVFAAKLRNSPVRHVRVSNKALSVHGRVVNDGMAKYLNNPAICSSALKEALKSPMHYFYHRMQTFEPRNLKHFDLGTFAHMAFLEPKRFDRVSVAPEINRAEREGVIRGIQFYQTLLQRSPDCVLSDLKMSGLRDKLNELEMAATAEGWQVVDADHKKIIDIVKSGYNTYGGGLLPRLFLNAKSEISMYGTDPQTGIKVRIRPDAILLEEDFGINAVISVKTTSSTTLEGFINDAAKYRYELSEGMYLDVASQVTGRDFSATVMVMLQTVIPFQIAVFYWDAEDLQIGKYKYRQALDTIKECQDKNCYPGFDSKAEEGHYGLIQMKLPDRIKRELLSVYIENNPY